MMQVSQYHKERGDEVFLYSPVFHKHYDKIYCFSIFTFTSKETVTSDMIVGGTGFDPLITLPEDIEKCKYDWSLFPNCPYSIIWFSRGCIRNCSFCLVRKKEGYIHSVKPQNLNPRGSFIKVMDNNFFANPEWRTAIDQLKEWGQKVDFQGVDVRLLDQEQCDALNSLKHHRQINIAWDFPEIDLLPKLKQVVKWIKPYKLQCYVLTGFNSTPKQDYFRVEELRKLGIDPYVMIYNKQDKPFLKHFARWVNKKQIWRNTSWNDYYDSYKKKKYENPLKELVI